MEKADNLSVSPGDYEVSIKFNNEHVPDSPFIVPIATLSDEARRLTVTSLQVGSHTHSLHTKNPFICCTEPADRTHPQPQNIRVG